MEKTKEYYTHVVKVKNSKPTYTWPDVTVEDTKPIVVKGRTVEFDLWTYFRAYFKDDSSFAAASPSHQETDTKRTLVGYFELNLKAISPSRSNLINHMGTFVHEFYHIIVFNNALYEMFVDASLQPIGRANLINEAVTVPGSAANRYGYKGPNVLAFAKQHLNDNNLANVVMENDGGAGSAGSHWEHMYWATEFMSPTDTTPSMHSKLSFSMAVDSGWFEIDENYIEKYTYAEGAGAGF